MKFLLRCFLINLVSLWATTEILPGILYTGGFRSLAIGAAAFTVINLVLVPLLKILLLPLNLLTLGIFAWVTNVLAIYALTTLVPAFLLTSYTFPGFEYSGFVVPAVALSVFWVAVVASFLIGIFTHFLQWLVH